MASGDTKTEALLNILGNGGDASSYAGCCNTKTQNYILDAINRVQNVEDEVEELKNNPDVVDIVATYADLQAYDTQHLTDKDIIRVLNDENHDGESTYYRYDKHNNSWSYIGSSKQYSNFVGTDGQTAGVAGLVPAPATTDAGKFLKADGTWDTAGGSGGGVTILTSADYNYHGSGDTDDGVALWKLDPGLYNWGNQMKVYASNDSPITNGASAFVTEAGGNAKEYIEILAFLPSGGVSGTYSWFKVNYNTGAKINNISNVHFLTDRSVVQTPGTSTTDVMSQNAVSTILFRDPASMKQVQVGKSTAASGTNGATAVGYYSYATGDLSTAIGGFMAEAEGAGAVAIGTLSQANTKGEFNIGLPKANSTQQANYGYNGTAYRLLSGLYDGQSAHDAATYGQLQNAIINGGTTAPTTATVGAVGTLYSAVVSNTAHLYACTAIDDTTDPQNPSYTWTTLV